VQSVLSSIKKWVHRRTYLCNNSQAHFHTNSQSHQAPNFSPNLATHAFSYAQTHQTANFDSCFSTYLDSIKCTFKFAFNYTCECPNLCTWVGELGRLRFNLITLQLCNCDLIVNFEVNILFPPCKKSISCSNFLFDFRSCYS